MVHPGVHMLKPHISEYVMNVSFAIIEMICDISFSYPGFLIVVVTDMYKFPRLFMYLWAKWNYSLLCYNVIAFHFLISSLKILKTDFPVL